MTVDQGKATAGAGRDPEPAAALSVWLGRPWAALVAALVTLAVALYDIQRPSFTRDESATLLAIHRGFPDLVRMLGNVDVVHGAYYSLIWAVAHVAGSGPLAVRFPSALGAAVAAGFVVLIGQRLVSGWAGLAAGLVYAVLPTVSLYAEIAREYALVAAVATVASYLLVRVLDGTGARSRLVVGYGAAVAALGLLNVFGLLLVVAHAVALGVRVRGGGLAPADQRRLAVRWFVAVVAAVAVVSPMAVTGMGQLSQVGWIKTPGVSELVGMAGLVGDPDLVLVAVVVLAAAVGFGALAGGRARVRAQWPAGLLALAVPWLVLPPAILWVVSYAHPVYVFRYIAYCIPAVALLAGAALAALGRLGTVAGLVVFLLAGLPAQAAERGFEGHGYGIRRADEVVNRLAKRGDALLNVRFLPLNRSVGMERQLEAAYPYGLSTLRDITAGEPPASSATLGGTFASANDVASRLAGVQRLWVASWSPRPPAMLRAAGFVKVHAWHPRQVWLWLYERSGH